MKMFTFLHKMFLFHCYKGYSVDEMIKMTMIMIIDYALLLNM